MLKLPAPKQHHPFTAKTGVRFPLGAPIKSIDYRQPRRLIACGAQHLPDKRSRTSTDLDATACHFVACHKRKNVELVGGPSNSFCPRRPGASRIKRVACS